MAKKVPPLAERFASSYEPNEAGCWIWQGSVNCDGYGRIQHNRVSWPAHRLSYDLHVGGLRADANVIQRCGDRRCVNPEHLQSVPFDDPTARLYAGFEVDEASGCWVWKRAAGGFGYGAIYVRGRLERAHRLSYELHVGPIPDGLHVCHRCDNPPCVNPAHLFVGTQFDNLDDMTRKGRRWSKLTPDNVREIRAKHKTGATVSQLAREIGVSTPTVAKVIKGTGWRHVGGDSGG